ncbi:rhombosortase [Vibrio sp. HA2012]|uniref:rhombosortase n=1 Tax=Vibrio sp. HA2012 TaxID=1971595 RepID=UPI000C2B9520|nr:rhombosortase [Vibrio sp. HA2012]PJC85385.1 rhombosortase [Vibrio sp. HA2012]
MRLYLALLLISIIVFLLQLPELQSLAEWNKELIKQGQWWRILTGNYTHTNLPHMGMNLLALWLMGNLFRPAVKNLLSVLSLISAIVGITLLLSSMQIYLGLSGILHGIFAYYALKEALSGRQSSWLLVAGISIKIGWEQWYGASADTASLIGARVAIEAHLIGGITGGLLTIVTHPKDKNRHK